MGPVWNPTMPQMPVVGRSSGTASGCTPHLHSFFGRLTAQAWAILMYKHLDHHLRQFGV
jgi:hypothetical protein